MFFDCFTIIFVTSLQLILKRLKYSTCEIEVIKKFEAVEAILFHRTIIYFFVVFNS